VHSTAYKPCKTPRNVVARASDGSAAPAYFSVHVSSLNTEDGNEKRPGIDVASVSRIQSRFSLWAYLPTIYRTCS
jgi:hypothetical protein